MANLTVIIGSAGSGKTQMSQKLVRGQKSLVIPFNELHFIFHADGHFDVLVLEEGHSDAQFQQLMRIHKAGEIRIKLAKGGEVVIPVKRLIAIFQKKELPADWGRQLMHAGAQIHLLADPNSQRKEATNV